MTVADRKVVPYGQCATDSPPTIVKNEMTRCLHPYQHSSQLVAVVAETAFAAVAASFLTGHLQRTLSFLQDRLLTRGMVPIHQMLDVPYFLLKKLENLLR